MNTTKRNYYWLDLGACPPEDGAYPPPHEMDSRVAAVKDTKLSVHSLTYGHMVMQRAEYACVHARVHVELIDRSPQLDMQGLGRVALALHAWGFTCNCFRIDWESIFGKPPSRRTLNSAHRWALVFQQSHPGCRVRFAARLPVDPSWGMKTTAPRRGAA